MELLERSPSAITNDGLPVRKPRLARLVARLQRLRGSEVAGYRSPYRLRQAAVHRRFFDCEKHQCLAHYEPAAQNGEHNIVPERPWETFIVGGWGTVMEDDGLYKMWYEASAFDGTKAEDNLSEEQLHQYLYKHLKRHVAYAVSRDGVHWDRPKLGLIDANGSREPTSS